jgi:hypothetical protein
MLAARAQRARQIPAANRLRTNAYETSGGAAVQVWQT